MFRLRPLLTDSKLYMSTEGPSCLPRSVEILSISIALLCCAACSEGTSARGFVVDVATASRPCSNSRHIIATAVSGQRASLNGEPPADIPDVRRRLREILASRAKKLVFVEAEAGVPWENFIELVEQLSPEADLLSIVTPKIDNLWRRTDCLYPSCRDCAKFVERNGEDLR